MRVYIYKEHPTVVVARNRTEAHVLLMAALMSLGPDEVVIEDREFVPLDIKTEGAYVLGAE